MGAKRLSQQEGNKKTTPCRQEWFEASCLNLDDTSSRIVPISLVLNRSRFQNPNVPGGPKYDGFE
jgi:hypothetical protein